jgi:dethiobiotin synthetase
MARGKLCYGQYIDRPTEAHVTRGYFVTGTDTGVGKTRVSLGLMHLLQKQGHVVTGMKPVASGCRPTPAGLINDDALLLQARASFTVPYHQVNPYAFEPPIAPHIAARQLGMQIELGVIEQALADLTQAADRVIVEGVGGWLVPIDAQRTMADVAAALKLPVVMVVGIRLGCLSHALLTAAAIDAAPVTFAGWIANHPDPDCDAADEIIASLRERFSVRFLGKLDHCPGLDESVVQFERINLEASAPFS